MLCRRSVLALQESWENVVVSEGLDSRSDALEGPGSAVLQMQVPPLVQDDRWENRNDLTCPPRNLMVSFLQKPTSPQCRLFD